MKQIFTVAALAAAITSVSAQSEAAPYGQCGGHNYGGTKSCSAGYHCHVYNPFYSQCIPGTALSAARNCTTDITITASGKIASASVSASAINSANITSSSFDIASATLTEPSSYGSIALTYSLSTPSSSVIEVVSSFDSLVISSHKAQTTSKTPTVKPTSSTKSTLETKVATSVKTSNASSAKSTASSSKATSISIATSSKSASTAVATSYSTTSGSQFVIDGETGYFAGTNAYWIGFLTNNSDVDLVMQHLKESGLKVLRVWGFNDVTSTPSSGTVYFQSFAGSTPTINTGADGLQRLDYVVKSAEAHGIKLIINFVNNWTDYGGMAAYFTYAGITDNTQWFNNTKAQTQYQKYIEAVVSRYSDSSAVFAWELANEPRCTGCDLSIMQTWIKTTATYIKSLDANHMVTTGEEGFGLSVGDDGSYPYTTGAGGYNFSTNCAIEEIDFCTYHLYPESWDVTPTQSWGNDWITNHAKACEAAGKPCLLEEFGASDNCTIESSWQATALTATGTGGDMFWQYGDTLSTGETSQDGNTVYYGTDLYTCIVTNHIKAIDAA